MLKIRHPRSVYVAGNWIKVAKVEPVINPANEEVLFEAPVSGVEVADAAIAAARDAFDNGPWPRMSQHERNAFLARFIDAIEARRSEVIDLIIAESGATRQGTEHFSYTTAIQHSRSFLEFALRPAITPLPVETVPNAFGTTTLAAASMVREPIGVVSAITPFNAPLLLNLAKLIPALAVGCTIILKPSPFTPMEALILGEFADEAGLPKGVFSVVTGDVEIGTMLTSDPRIDLVSFTGSDKVGALIQSQAAPHIKRVLLELGGKSAMIVREDADLDAAAQAGLFSIVFQCGQGCGLHTRHLVHKSLRQAYVEKVRALLPTIQIGDPNDLQTTMGPLINAQAIQRTEEYVELGLQQGGRLIMGGNRPPQFKSGFFFEPTLFDNVDNNFRIAREEIFGPIGVVIEFEDDDDAIAIANDSEYGLSGGIFSKDVGRAYEMALRLRTGNVILNGGSGHVSSHHPFGGYKRSGIGREYGVEGLNEFTEIKTITFKGA